jgi:hypothetical protein
MTPKIIPSDICSAFQEKAIGTVVTFHDHFMDVIEAVVSQHDFEKERVPGQAYIEVPAAVPFVLSGVGKKSPEAWKYHCREHRGVVSAYLKREFAAPVESCAIVVYTRDAYLKDPDVTPEEAARIDAEGATHVLVAVLASAGPPSPLPPYRLVWNLAGGNREAALWTADEIRAKAKAAIEFNNEWSTVAD